MDQRICSPLLCAKPIAENGEQGDSQNINLGRTEVLRVLEVMKEGVAVWETMQNLSMLLPNTSTQTRRVGLK